MDALRIISLGGFASVTQNMYAYHFLPNGKEEGDQILIVDCGVGFPEQDALGVDLVIPDTTYIAERKDKVVGIVLTHGHEDHIGSLPFVLPLLSPKTSVFGSRLTVSLAEEKLKEGNLNFRLNIFKAGDYLRFGKFSVTPIRVTHSIPDTFHLLIETPLGNFYHGADFKLDTTPPDGILPEFGKIVTAGEKGIICLLSDCLGSEKEGYSPSETELDQMFEEKIRQAKGRVFITAISSSIYRWQKAIEASKKFGRKICLVGLSIEKIVRVASELAYLKLKKDDLVEIRKAVNLPDNKVTFLVAGSLGQSGSALDKIVLGKHQIQVKKGDRFVFSSPDYVPGTTKAIHRLIDLLIQQETEVVYDSGEEMLHVSGHGYRQELSLLITLTSPRYLLPIGGEWRQIHQYGILARKMGYHAESLIVPKDDSVPTFWSSGKIDFNFKLSLRKVLVDGLGVGDVGKTVLRDRRILAKEGMIVLILLIDNETKGLSGKPMVVSRGFVYVKENRELLNEIVGEVEKNFEHFSKPILNVDDLRYQLQGRIEEFIFKKTGRQPMVLPVVLEV